MFFCITKKLSETRASPITLCVIPMLTINLTSLNFVGEVNPCLALKYNMIQMASLEAPKERGFQWVSVGFNRFW